MFIRQEKPRPAAVLLVGGISHLHTSKTPLPGHTNLTIGGGPLTTVGILYLLKSRGKSNNYVKYTIDSPLTLTGGNGSIGLIEASSVPILFCGDVTPNGPAIGPFTGVYIASKT